MNEEFKDWSDEQLRQATQGCTELSCMYHGAINQEIRDRKEAKRKGVRPR